MLTLTICVTLVILFVKNSSLVITGAAGGLMLWYQKLLPMLLPFMLISGIIVGKVNELSQSQKRPNKKIAILSTIFIGIFCGYPLGAKACSEFSCSGSYSKKTGNLLIALCNNSSPMFISGFLANGIFKNTIPLWHIFLYIYIPYIIVLAFSAAITHFSKTHDDQTENYIPKAAASISTSQYIMNMVSQITQVGIYVMLCSIAIEFVYSMPKISRPLSLFLSGIIEITRGTTDIMLFLRCPAKIKTALIIALTSFGGISSIFQTHVVIQESELSIAGYILKKIICATLTFAMIILFI